MDARAVGRDDAQQPAAVLVAQLEVADDEEVLERGVLREAAHPLEADPGLVDGLAAPIVTIAPGVLRRWWTPILRGERGLRVAAREDRAISRAEPK